MGGILVERLPPFKQGGPASMPSAGPEAGRTG
jgi:hypothetical protein